MKEIIINILILIICVNLIILIFPEGKTQKYCKLVIRIYIVVYLFSSIIKSFDFNINEILDSKEFNTDMTEFERNLNIDINDKEIIDLIESKAFNNKVNVLEVIANYDNDFKITIKINKRLDKDELSYGVNEAANILEINSKNINILYEED